MIDGDRRDLPDLLVEPLEAVVSTLGPAAAGVWLLDPSRSSLELCAARGPAGGAAAALRHLPADPEGPARALSEREIIRVGGAEAGAELALPSPFAAGFAAPLRAQGEPLGLLLMLDRAARRLDARDCAFLAAVANQIALTVDYARLYAATRQEHAQFRTILERVPDGVLLVDAHGRVLRLNPAAAALLEVGPHEPVATLEERLIALDVRDSDGRRPGPGDLPPARVLARGEVVRDERWLLGGPNRRPRAIGISAAPVRDEAGRLAGGVVVLRDATAEEELERLKDEFLAVISHELHTPLTAILGYTDILLAGIRGPLTPDQADIQRAIRENAQRLLRLINDLLDVTRLKARGVTLTPHSGSVHDAAEIVVRRLAEFARRRGVQVRNEVPTDLPAARADDEKLQQVLSNLVSNAIKSSEASGQVWITARVDAHPQTGAPELVVSVHDLGVGIPPEQQARIWDRFQQVDSSARRRFGGAGIGLVIVRGLVELHGGRVWVESEGVPGKGAVFSFTLPLASAESVAEAAAAAPAASVPPPTATNPLPAELAAATDSRAEAAPPPAAEATTGMGAGTGEAPPVLVVDDDADLVRIVQAYLQAAGYRTLVAMSARQAVRLARERRPFAVILDVRLPDGDGWSVLHQLKRDPATERIPVVMLSVLPGRDVGLAMGAVEYLVKPVERERLLATLRRVAPVPRPLILVVDDDPHLLDILHSTLEAGGMGVLTAATGAEALPLLYSRRPDVVVLDLMMPGIDGFEVLRSIRASETLRELPVIVLTAKTLSAEERRWLDNTAQFLVSKSGLHLEKLLAEVRRSLDQLGRRTDAGALATSAGGEGTGPAGHSEGSRPGPRP